jgi:beta-galactosidase
VAGTNILYSTAEVFTWKKTNNEKVVVLYGGPGEHHEFAVSGESSSSVVEGSSSSISSKKVSNALVVAWDVSRTRRIVQVGNLEGLPSW